MGKYKNVRETVEHLKLKVWLTFDDLIFAGIITQVIGSEGRGIEN